MSRRGGVRVVKGVHGIIWAKLQRGNFGGNLDGKLRNGVPGTNGVMSRGFLIFARDIQLVRTITHADLGG